MKIGFIGAGNMGGAILRGYIERSGAADDEIFVTRRDKDALRRMESELGITACDTAEEVAAGSRILFMAVKPKDYPQVLQQIAGAWTQDKVMVSMAAGVTTEQIADVLGADARIIRIMPNTPAQVGEGMTSVSSNRSVSEDDMRDVSAVLSAVGRTGEVDESLIHTVIGVSGSSPAYTYMYIKALMDAAVANGMSEQQAREFASQAVIGAATMVLETGEDPQVLCDNVCSPGGTTIEAVDSLRADGFEDIVRRAFQAAVDKSVAMSRVK